MTMLEAMYETARTKKDKKALLLYMQVVKQNKESCKSDLLLINKEEDNLSMEVERLDRVARKTSVKMKAVWTNPDHRKKMDLHYQEVAEWYDRNGRSNGKGPDLLNSKHVFQGGAPGTGKRR